MAGGDNLGRYLYGEKCQALFHLVPGAKGAWSFRWRGHSPLWSLFLFHYPTAFHHEYHEWTNDTNFIGIY